MKKIIPTLCIVLMSPLSFAIDEKEPIAVQQEPAAAVVAKPSGNAEWLSKRDVWSDIHFKASLDTLSYKSLDDELEVDWSIEVGNVDKDEKEYVLSYSHSYDRQTDLFSKQAVRNTEVNITQDFDINKIEGRIGWTTHFSLDQTKENNIFVQKYNIEAAPLGIKYDIYESDKITELSLSYLPTFNYLEHYDSDTDSLGNPVLNKGIERSLLHVVRLNFTYNVNNFTFSDSIHWKKIKAFDDAIKNQRDSIFSNEMSLSYQIFGSFSIAYKNTIQVDKRRKAFQDLPSTDHQHGISFAFEWN